MKTQRRTARTGPNAPTKKNVARWSKSAATARGTKADKATGKAVLMVKLVGVAMRLKEHNNHLQGLYAELGKIVYEQQMRKKAVTAKPQSTGAAGLAEKITLMKKKMTLLEQQAKALKKAV